MCINRYLKAAVVHPTTLYLQKTTLFFNYRIKAYKNLLRELFPERFIKPAEPNTVVNSSKQAARQEENIVCMCSEIQKAKLLPREIECNCSLFNAFNGEKATPEQANDKLTFRQIGTQAFHQYVTYYILKQHSTNAPVRRRKF